MSSRSSTASTGTPLVVRWHRPIGWVLLVYWLALFTGTHIPLERVPGPEGSDKVIHILAYAGLTFWLTFWRCGIHPLTGKRATRIFLIVAGYGIMDELLQIPVNRACEFLDLMADWSGSLLVLLTLYCSRNLLVRRNIFPKGTPLLTFTVMTFTVSLML